MKALQLEQPKQFRFIDIPEPPAPGPGEAVVRVARVGVCGTDYSGYLGKMPFFSYPRIPGHELGVEVLAVGLGVTNVKPGDRAAIEPYINCQNCYSCARGHTNACENHQTLGVHCDGGLRPRFTIPARKLYDYIKLLPEGDISIKLMDNHWVQIRAGRSNTKMVGMARANFPQVPEFPASSAVKISVSSLKNMVSKTIFAISNEESRYTLNGALLVLKAESMAMVATDGHRLAHIEKLGETLEGISGEKKTLIPRKALSELSGLLGNTEAEALEFADDDQTLFFKVGGRVLTSRKLTGQFPNYEAVLPRDNTKFVIVRSEDLMGSIQRVAQFADERSGAIKIRLEQNELKLSSSSTDAGESEDTIETPYNYDPLVVGFNSQYLIDFLKAIGNTGEVRLEFKDAQSAGQMRPEDANEDVKYRYILMPMRI